MAFLFFIEKYFCKWLGIRKLERVVMRVLSDLEGLSLLLGILGLSGVLALGGLLDLVGLSDSGGISGLCRCGESAVCAAWKLPPQGGSYTPGESPTGQRILSGLAGYGEVE